MLRNHVRRLEQRTLVSLLSTLTKCAETRIRRLRRCPFYNMYWDPKTHLNLFYLNLSQPFSTECPVLLMSFHCYNDVFVVFQLRTDNEYIAPHDKHALLHSVDVMKTYLYSFQYRADSHPYPDWMGKHLIPFSLEDLFSGRSIDQGPFSQKGSARTLRLKLKIFILNSD